MSRLRLPTALLAGLLLAQGAAAGGGPETTLVVVNADSPLSQRIANAYVQLRDIPQTHVVRLHRVPSISLITIDAFRERIWRPIRDHLRTSALDGHIDIITYSADFPYRVDFTRDLELNGIEKSPYRGRFASLTGLTYFARRVEAGNTGYLGVNRYYRRNLARRLCIPSSRRPKREETELKQRAERLAADRDYRAAAEAYRELSRRYTFNGASWYGLARSLGALGRNDEAQTALENAVSTCWANSVQARGDELLAGLRDQPAFEQLLENMDAGSGPFQRTRGFRSRYAWGEGGRPAPTEGTDTLNRYYLSTLLAYTGVRGNSVPEALGYLRSAVASDGARPDGTVYLLENTDVRSETRQPLFPATVRALEKRGRRVAILGRGKDRQRGVLPEHKDDVIGAVVGAHRFDWSRSGSRLLPGSIAESLTSYGGHFDNQAQTKLTEFLRHGAAGSSGAVAEPYSFQAKFPVPPLHVYYADGASLAEAFYQSVAAPYQLIIVGDPLARPFARFAQVSLAAPDPTVRWRGRVTLQPRVHARAADPISWVELWVDGRYLAQAPVDKPITWDTTTVEDGSHELRLVAVGANRLETRSYKRVRVTIANTNRQISVEPFSAATKYGDPVALRGQAPGAARVEIFQGLSPLGMAPVEGGRWRIAFPSSALGLGQATLFARASFADGAAIRSPPIAAAVNEPPRLAGAGWRLTSNDGLEGLVRDVDGRAHSAVITALNGRLKQLGGLARDPTYVELAGEFEVENAGSYALILKTIGKISVDVGRQQYLETILKDEQSEAFLPLSLDAGWHRIRIQLVPIGAPYLKAILAGDHVATILAGEMLRH